MNKTLSEFIQLSQTRVEAALEARLPSANVLPTRLHQAMLYSVLEGGKRMRPVLTYSTGHALEIEPDRLDGLAAAVEFIHVYSLIHDDLPAMDDDELRRGKPTCHIAFDEATAILAGDALQALAFDVTANDSSIDAKAQQRNKMISVLAKASGSRGMVGGQAIDLESIGKALTLPELENMHIHKTGALISASVELATLLDPEIDSKLSQKLLHYARCIGLSFQIIDDILDEVSDTQTLGKTQGKDKNNNKPNYPALIGLDGSMKKAKEMHQLAIASLDVFGPEADLLRDLSLYIIERDH
ncbi:MAG: farnesyl diphosphate synthase [Methylococcaceae bacterium]